MRPTSLRYLAVMAFPLFLFGSSSGFGAQAKKPDAYLHALATGADNHQLIVRLPMIKQADGALMGVKGRSHLDDYDRDPDADLTKLPSQGYTWEIVGEYREECPTEYQYKITRETDTHKKTKKKVSFPNSIATTPKQQSLVVLPDGSFIFSCDRSHIHLKHPNRLPGWRPGTTPAPANKVFDYPEISFNLKNFHSLFFDFWNNNNEYGISLARNEIDNVVYASFEDKIYVFDLQTLKTHFHRVSQPFFHPEFQEVSFNRTPAPGIKRSNVAGHQRIVDSVHPEASEPNEHDWSLYFYLFNEFPVNRDFRGYSIISLAVAYQENDGRPFLFSSYATPDSKEAKTPVQMHWLQVDGRSEVAAEELPSGPALQYARLVYKDGKPDPDNNGLKADITFITADTDPKTTPTLGLHVHHNHPAIVYQPFMNSEPLIQILEKLGPHNAQTMFSMNPEVLNEAMHSASETQVNPIANPVSFHLFKIGNTGVNNEKIMPTLDNYDERIAPSRHSYYDRMASRKAIGKPPKLVMNHDMFLIRQGVYYFMPSKDDVTLSIIAHVLPAAEDNVTYGWGHEPAMNWQEVARLPDMLERLEPCNPEKFMDNPDAKWWPGGLNWAAYSFDPVH